MSESPSSPESFQTLIARVRAGDEQAAAELVRRYEPAIRRAARVRLLDTRLNRLLDSMDICQSVMASFFVRTALGQFELETPDQLLKLLATMTRNKLAEPGQGPWQQPGATFAGFRLSRVIATMRRLSAAPERIAGHDPTPSRDLAARELLEEALRRLSPEEKRILDCREQGGQWTEIAAGAGLEPGGDPQAAGPRGRSRRARTGSG